MAQHRHRHCRWLYPDLAPHADQRLRQRRRDPSLLRLLQVRLGQLRSGCTGQTFLKRSQRDTLWKGECLYGHLAIAAFRRTLTSLPQRTLRNTTIMTNGTDVVTANTEFVHVGKTRLGRSTQTWVRMPEGWRIAAAHGSFLLGGSAPEQTCARPCHPWQ
ncbi:MAG: DUF3225 domain-containing protein [Rhodobacteraceae bacterium]|nr:DUF3225 domain-containing protein [Paracoccaceae bacterium]